MVVFSSHFEQQAQIEERLDLSSIYPNEDTRVGVGYNGLMVGFVLGKERKKIKGELGTE